MPTYPTLPGTYAPNDTPAASELNAIVTTLTMLTGPPSCEVRLTSDVTQTATDIIAQNGWNVPSGADPMGMANLSATAGTASWIQIPTGWAGRYVMHFHAIVTGLSSPASAAAHITLNSTTVTTAAIASDLDGATAGGAIELDAHRERVMAAGDKLFWSTWASTTGGTLKAANLTSVLTMLTVRWVGQV
jgi:hypothetical protein